MKNEFRTVGYSSPQIKNGKDRVKAFKTYGEAYDDYNDIKKDKKFNMVSLEAYDWKIVLQNDKRTKGVKK